MCSKGFEPPTHGLEGRCSIQLSYRLIMLFRKSKAGDGNRTHVSSLEGWCSTIELHPHVVGVTGFEPATSWSQTRRSSQAEPHPEGFVCVLSVTQELVYSKGKNMSTTFFIFFIFEMSSINCKFFSKIFSAYFTTNMHFHIHHICFCPTTPNPPVTAGFF